MASVMFAFMCTHCPNSYIISTANTCRCSPKKLSSNHFA